MGGMRKRTVWYFTTDLILVLLMSVSVPIGKYVFHDENYDGVQK